MIINCVSCKKNFQVKDGLIPESGRSLKCGICGNKWFFKPDREINLNNQIITDEIQIDNPGNELKQIAETEEPKIPPITEQIIKEAEISTKAKKYDEINTKKTNFINNFFVILITFIGILIIFDTFKNELSNIIPGIIPLLDNLYQSLYDIYLFFKDLIK